MPSSTQANQLLGTEILADRDQQKRVPGDFAMWAFIVMELTVFAIFLVGFAVTQRLYPQMFSLGRSTLDISVGLFCTLSLIISSYFVALAVHAIKRSNHLQAMRMLIFALLTATVYLGLKLSEYSALADLSYGLSSNTFYTLYFFITGFHFMHVLLGMVILAYMANKARRNGYAKEDYSGFESGAAYWHMIDLVWVNVFFLIYIIH